MNEDLTDEEQYRNVKRPSTGLARKYAQKQLKEENVLAKLLKVQSEKFGETLIEMKADGTPDVKPAKKSLSITEAREIALQPIETRKAKSIAGTFNEATFFETISLDEAIDLAITENWKDNINNLSPGKQDTIKKLLSLADSIRNNTPLPEFTLPKQETPAPASTQLFENAKLISQKYSLKEAMAMVHILQDSQKSVFLDEREDIIEKWSDVIAEALIDNKKHIITDPKGQILRVE